MHAVGNGVDRVLGEHMARYLAMPLGNAVDEVAVVQGQICHVQHIVQAELSCAIIEGVSVACDDTGQQVQRKLVVPRANRCMRGEDT